MVIKALTIFKVAHVNIVAAPIGAIGVFTVDR